MWICVGLTGRLQKSRKVNYFSPLSNKSPDLVRTPFSRLTSVWNGWYSTNWNWSILGRTFHFCCTKITRKPQGPQILYVLLPLISNLKSPWNKFKVVKDRDIGTRINKFGALRVKRVPYYNDHYHELSDPTSPPV